MFLRRLMLLMLIVTQTKENKVSFWTANLKTWLYQDTNEPTKKLCYHTFSAGKIYRSAILFKRYEWLMRMMTFHNQCTLRTDFLDNRFAYIRWFMTQRSKTLSPHRACCN